MKIKLLQNITHEGVFFRAGEVIDGIVDSVCESIVSRGLAEQSDEDAHKVYSEKGVEPKSVVNPAAEHSAPNDQSTTTAVAGQPVVPAAGVAPTATATPAVNPATPEAQQANVTAPEPTAAPNGETTAVATGTPVAPVAPAAQPGNPSPEDIQKAIEGIQ
jgi:hypothetical protein